MPTRIEQVGKLRRARGAKNLGAIAKAELHHIAGLALYQKRARASGKGVIVLPRHTLKCAACGDAFEPAFDREITTAEREVRAVRGRPPITRTVKQTAGTAKFKIAGINLRVAGNCECPGVSRRAAKLVADKRRRRRSIGAAEVDQELGELIVAINRQRTPACDTNRQAHLIEPAEPRIAGFITNCAKSEWPGEIVDGRRRQHDAVPVLRSVNKLTEVNAAPHHSVGM